MADPVVEVAVAGDRCEFLVSGDGFVNQSYIVNFTYIIKISLIFI